MSIVTYFALPPYLGSELDDDGNPVPLDDAMEKFLALFGHFINIPVSEEERLATWGISSKKKVFSQSSKKRNKSSDERPSANDLRESSTDNPFVPISTELVVEQSEKVEDTDSEGEADGNELEPGTLTEQGFSGVAGAEPQKAAAAGNSWMQMPSDISWPDPHEPGALPQSDFRNARWKLIPSVTEGPWVVRTAVRSQPALLGRKVVQRYFRGSNYMEIDVHVGSSIIASQIVGVCRGYGKHFAADVGITIQGEENAELPEKMLGCASFHKIDIDIRQKVD